MVDKKLVNVLLDGAVVFVSIMLGGKVQQLVDEVKFLQAKDKLNNAVIEGQQKIIESYNSKKEES